VKSLDKLGSDWDSMLQGISIELKDTVRTLSSHVAELDGVTHAIQGKSICFYHGRVDARTLFAVFLLTENSLRVRITTDPSVDFQDPQRWTGEIQAWKTIFIRLLRVRPTRVFTVTSKEQIEYAMDLITQSYLQTTPIPYDKLQKTSIGYQPFPKWYKGKD
jgi:hypothetical protein